MKAKRTVLAYSGGLDTSIIIPWLRENYGCEVIAMCADLGQGDNMAQIRKKAIATGASQCIVKDLRKEFVTDFIFPTLRASAIYEGKYLLGTSHARPLIAKHQMAVAKTLKADAVSHGATGKGNDQVRFELTYMHFNPRITIIAPWKDDRWTMHSREEAIDYARTHKVPVSQTKKKIYSEDGNLWHLSHEGGNLEDPWNEPQSSLYSISSSPEKAPGRPEYVSVGFEKGNPTSVNGRKLSPVKLVETLNRIGAKHAIGHCDMVENRLVGMKSRGVYETPGGTILYTAHDELERLVLDKESYHFKALLGHRYAELVYNGQWYTPLREALDAFVNVTQRNVTGTVKLKLYKGSVRPAGSKSPHSLYSAKLSSFSDDLNLYDQKDATGFIRLLGLPIKTAALLRKGK